MTTYVSRETLLFTSFYKVLPAADFRAVSVTYQSEVFQ